MLSISGKSIRTLYCNLVKAKRLKRELLRQSSLLKRQIYNKLRNLYKVFFQQLQRIKFLFFLFLVLYNQGESLYLLIACYKQKLYRLLFRLALLTIHCALALIFK